MKSLHLSLLVGIVIATLAFNKVNYYGSSSKSIMLTDTIPAQVYIDLNTGDTLDIWYDSVKNFTTNRRNKRRVDFYVDPMTLDTFYGTGPFLVNGFIVRLPNGKYGWDTTKVKVENNKIKINDGDQKAKIKWEENKLKLKDREGKLKLKDKGDTVKIKQ